MKNQYKGTMKASEETSLRSILRRRTCGEFQERVRGASVRCGRAVLIASINRSAQRIHPHSHPMKWNHHTEGVRSNADDAGVSCPFEPPWCCFPPSSLISSSPEASVSSESEPGGEIDTTCTLLRWRGRPLSAPSSVPLLSVGDNGMEMVVSDSVLGSGSTARWCGNGNCGPDKTFRLPSVDGTCGVVGGSAK